MTGKSFEFQSDIVKEGKKAIKITVRSNDKFEAGDLKNLSTERDELLMSPSYAPYEGLKYEYKFSMFLPPEFLVVNTRLVIAQWKQFCPVGDSCSENSPDCYSGKRGYPKKGRYYFKMGLYRDLMQEPMTIIY